MEEQDQDEIYASELKETLLRLRPDFNEKAYGCATFYKLLTKLANRFGDLRVHNDNFNVMVGLTNAADNGEVIPQLTRENWKEAFAAQIRAYKEGGFDRVNPSILKADIITAYPDFNERSIGFKRFSDVMKQLEKDGLKHTATWADFFATHNIHVHVPEGATPKDGPSAGITIATSIASAITGRKVRKQIAMTGEITLRGKVLPIGGVKEKILAAKRAGITDIVCCEENRRNVEEVPAIYTKGLTFHYVKTVKDVLEFALLK